MLSVIKQSNVVKISRRFYATLRDNDVVVLGVARTPFGSFNGALSTIEPQQLAAIAVDGAFQQCGASKSDVDEMYTGIVMGAGVGQNICKQVAVAAGLPDSVICTTINKACSSSLKCVMLSTISLMTGQHKGLMVAAGVESMSRQPYIIKREGTKYGSVPVTDELSNNLHDAYTGYHMGKCADLCAEKMKISREEQDEYGMESYRRAAAAYQKNIIQKELVSVKVPKGKDNFSVVEEDEEYKRVNFNKFSKLKAVFSKDGTVTAANSSPMSDGGSACILATAARAKELGLTPLARILTVADGETTPVDFPIAPAIAMKKILSFQKLKVDDIDCWEINEAFSVVVLANIKLLGLDHAKVNVHGGAVSLGHPPGASGCRIVGRLAHSMEPGQLGVASMCNAGGGASAVLLEKL